MTTRDAAKIYGVPGRTIRRWHAEGRLTDPVKRQGRLLWNPDEIEQLASLRKGTTRLARAPACTGETQ